MSYRVGNVDVLQSLASPKRFITNMSYGVGYADARIFRETRYKNPIR